MNLTPFAAATKKYNVRGISWDSADGYGKVKKMISISHWCRDAGHSKPIGDIPGFKTIFRFGNLEIRKQINPSSQYVRFDAYTRDVLQPGTDVNYEPTVKRRFWLKERLKIHKPKTHLTHASLFIPLAFRLALFFGIRDFPGLPLMYREHFFEALPVIYDGLLAPT